MLVVDLSRRLIWLDLSHLGATRPLIICYEFVSERRDHFKIVAPCFNTYLDINIETGYTTKAILLFWDIFKIPILLIFLVLFIVIYIFILFPLSASWAQEHFTSLVICCTSKMCDKNEDVVHIGWRHNTVVMMLSRLHTISTPISTNTKKDKMHQQNIPIHSHTTILWQRKTMYSQQIVGHFPRNIH